MDLSKVMVSKKEATEIIMQVRTRLVSWLKEDYDREYANNIVTEWLRNQNNILSPYAADVVSQLYINPTEIKWRKEFGDEFTDAWIRAKSSVMDAMKK